MRSPLRKLAALDARGLADLWQAQRALLAARRLLKQRPIGSLTIRDTGDDGPVAGDAVRAREVARAVSRAATYGLFRPFCLVRALALRELLRREGIRGTDIRIGVRRRGADFTAHAWVRWGSEILGDEPAYVATFTEVDDIRVLGSP